MSCSCGTCSGCLSTETITIPNGASGSNGSNGFFGGFSGEWVFDSATSANPPLTELRFDNATLASVTNIYINDTNADSTDYNSFLEQFKNNISGTNYYGLVRVWKQHNSNIFWIGKITAVTDNGADHTIAVTHIASNGTFTDEDDVVISFTPQGSNGTNGSSVAGSLVIDSVFDDTTAITTAAGNMVSLSLPANTLDSDEELIEFDLVISRTAAVANVSDTINLSFGNQGYSGDVNEQFSALGIKHTADYVHITGKIDRQTSVLGNTTTKVFYAGSVPAGDTVITGTDFALGNSDVSIDWTQINLLQVNLLNSANSNLTVVSFTMKHVPK